MANNTAPCTSSNSPSLSDGNVHAKLVDTKQTGEYSGGRKEQNKQLLAKENIAPPDGGWGWVVVFAAFIVYFIVFGTLRCQSVLFVPIMDVFRSDYSSVGWVAAVATTGLAVAGLLSAPLMSKIGHRYTIILGGFVACVASVLSYFAPNIIVLDLTAGLMTGVGLGMSFVSSPVLIGFYFEKKRALATNLASMGASVGTFAICPLNSLIIEQFSLRGYFLLFGGLFLQLCVCGALMRPVTSVAASVERRDEGSESMIEEQSEIEEVEESSPGSSTSWRSLAVHKPYIVYCISQIFFLAGFIVNQLYIVPFAEEELGVSSIKAPLVMSIMAGTELLSRIIFGFLGDLKRINRLLMFASVLLLLALCCLLIPFTNSFESLAGVSAVTGLFQGGFSGISIVVLADIVGIKLYGTALGISTTLNGIGTLLSPPLIGIAVNHSNKPSTALFISSGFLFLGAILTFMIHVVIRFEQKHHSPTTSEEE